MSEARYLRKQSNKQGSEHLIQVILYLRGMLRLYLHILLLAFSARKTMVFFSLDKLKLCPAAQTEFNFPAKMPKKMCLIFPTKLRRDHKG